VTTYTPAMIRLAPRRGPPARRPLTTFFIIPILLASVFACEQADPLAAARASWEEGNYEASADLLRPTMLERRDDPEILFLYGRSLLAGGRATLAEWSLREAANHPDYLARAGMLLANSALDSLNYHVAIEYTTRILAADPENLDARLLRANAYAQAGPNAEEALADAAIILETDPDNAEAMEPRILALLALSRPEEAGEAIDELGRMIEEQDLGPTIAGWHCTTGSLFAQESGDIELARSRFETCLESHPAHPNLVSNSIRFYDGLGETDRSLEIIRAACEDAPRNRNFRTALSSRLTARGENAEAEALLRAATDSENAKHAAGAWADLAQHYQGTLEYSKAAEAVGKARKLSRDVGSPNPNLLLIEADALMLSGELDRAWALTSEMDSAAHREVIRARVSQKRGDFVAALEHFDEAFRLWPNNAFARYHAAECHEALGQIDEAIESFRYSVRSKSGGTDARNRLARIHLAEGQLSEAHYFLHMGRQPDEPPEREHLLLLLQLDATLGKIPEMQHDMETLAAAGLATLAEIIVEATRGLERRYGSEKALSFLRSSVRTLEVDLSDPENADLVHEYVRLASEEGGKSIDDAATIVAKGIAAHPDAAPLHAIDGLRLELGGAPASETRRAYQRALDLDPGETAALMGLGRLALTGGDPVRALSLFDQVVALDEGNAEAKRGAADALTAAGRLEQAEQRLIALLAAHPYEGAAAMELARLQIRLGKVSENSIALTKRALRFGTDDLEALDLAAEIFEALEMTERAAAATRAAEEYRVRQAEQKAESSTG
jgi:tetratricopeptide (TPR) repeat protein